jgi:hypothetical protein
MILLITPLCSHLHSLRLSLKRRQRLSISFSVARHHPRLPFLLPLPFRQQHRLCRLLRRHLLEDRLVRGLSFT